MENEKKADAPANRAKRRKDASGKQSVLRRRIRSFKGVAIPRDQQPWANENSQNDER
jgi:hypothetical protein